MVVYCSLDSDSVISNRAALNIAAYMRDSKRLLENFWESKISICGGSPYLRALREWSFAGCTVRILGLTSFLLFWDIFALAWEES